MSQKSECGSPSLSNQHRQAWADVPVRSLRGVFLDLEQKAVGGRAVSPAPAPSVHRTQAHRATDLEQRDCHPPQRARSGRRLLRAAPARGSVW